MRTNRVTTRLEDSGEIRLFIGALQCATDFGKVAEISSIKRNMLSHDTWSNKSVPAAFGYMLSPLVDFV